MIKKKSAVLDALLVVGLFFWVYIQLMAGPIVGQADNGDFVRIMESHNFAYPNENRSDNYFNFFHRYFDVQPDLPKQTEGYFSSEAPILNFAYFLSGLFGNSGSFDILFLGWIHVALFVFAMFVLWAGFRRAGFSVRVFAVFASVFIFADISNLSYFNSFYSESASFIFLLMAGGFALLSLFGKKSPYLAFLGFIAAASLFIAAKTQNAPLGPLLFLFGVRLSFLHKKAAWRAFALAFSIVLLAVSFKTFSAHPKTLSQVTSYDSVFYGVLKDSPSPEKDLEELGISRKFAPFAGTTFYATRPKIEVNWSEFYGKVSHKKIVFFYLENPRRLFSGLETGLQAAGKVREPNIGNFEKKDGFKPRAVSHRFSFWSDLKQALAPSSLWVFLLYLACFVSVLGFKWLKAKEAKEKVFLELLLIVASMTLLSLAVPLLAEGQNDLVKHMFLYGSLLDIMLLSTLCWAAAEAWRFGKKAFNLQNKKPLA